MKQILSIALLVLASFAASAQTLNVHVGSITYQFPASQTGEMTYADGTTVTIMGKTFTLSDVSSMTVDNTAVTDNLVSIAYDGTSATVTVAGNVAQYVTPTISGAHVTITSTNTDAVDDDEITYQLSGTTTDGSLTLGGSYKSTISLAGVTLTNPSGAAITVNNSKRIQLSAKKDTENTLTDCSSGSQKACLYSKGQLQLQGNGTLNVAGNTKHGIKSASYISIKNLTLNVTAAASDGINCEEYFQLKSGTVTISGVGDDGIQCDLGGDSSTGITTDHEDEDSGNIYLEGGTLIVTVPSSVTAGKCVKSDGDIYLTGGTQSLNANAAIDLSDTTDPSYTAGFKADGSVVLQGAEATINVKGAAGRGVGATAFTSTSGAMTVTNSGATQSSGTSYYCTAKGIKATTVDIQGGTITVTTSGAASKGIKSDNGSMTISGGTLNITTTGSGAYDGTERDAKGCAGLKSDVNLTISGGTITLKSTGTGGKCIKVDGTMTVSDGTVTANSTGSKYSYSSSYTASAKGIKSTGAMVISGGTIIATSSSHEGVESKSTLDISGGDICVTASDDAINAASHLTISGGYVMANSTGNDGIDANGNLYIKGGNVFAIATSSPEVGLDANTEGGYALYISGGNVASIGGLEGGCSISNGSAYQASSYSKGTWYALLSGNAAAFAFKVPSNSKMGTPLCVYTSGTATLLSGVSGSGTALWDGNGYTGYSGGSSVSLSTYSGGGSGPGGGGPGGGGPGGGGRW